MQLEAGKWVIEDVMAMDVSSNIGSARKVFGEAVPDDIAPVKVDHHL